MFKYNDGTPFVGQPWTTYWDGGDSNGVNNNTTTGAGLGGNGTWDSASSKKKSSTQEKLREAERLVA